MKGLADGIPRQHVDTIVKKANFKLGFLYRNGRFMNFYVRRLLCQSLIFSNLEYCSPSWYFGLAAPLRESLNVLQRKCARFSLGHSPLVISVTVNCQVCTGYLFRRGLAISALFTPTKRKMVFLLHTFLTVLLSSRMFILTISDKVL